MDKNDPLEMLKNIMPPSFKVDLEKLEARATRTQDMEIHRQFMVAAIDGICAYPGVLIDARGAKTYVTKVAMDIANEALEAYKKRWAVKD